MLKDIQENDVVLFLLPKDKYTSSVEEIIRTLEKSFAKTCFVSINKPYSTLYKELKEKNIDRSRFVFIDVLTKTVTKVLKEKNVTYIDSPADLTALSMAVSDALREGCKSVFINSASTLLVYNKETIVIKLINSIITKARVANTKVIITSVEDNNTSFTKEIGIFADKVVRL